MNTTAITAGTAPRVVLGQTKTLTEKHSRVREAEFRFKSLMLVGMRHLQNAFSSIRKFADEGQLHSKPIAAVSESDLWSTDDNEHNWILTAGKIQNLRIAAKKLNGIEVEANQTFSFWKHVGNPNFGKGFVIGRELREGCIVPTIAGGLCQLSNALYDAALKANFEIVERHRHTQIIKGSLAEQGRDATVKWNYIDLRFRSRNSFRIEVELTGNKLIVKFRSKGKESTAGHPLPNTLLQSSKLNDCYSCGNFKCFKHPEKPEIRSEKAITAFILDEKWSEYDNYIQSISNEKDIFIIPIHKKHKDWTIKNRKNVRTASLLGIRRAVSLRFARATGDNIFERTLGLDKKTADEAAKLIPIESTHLVISQNLLPFLCEQGVLGGRTFDVLMNRLPMEKLHQRLDQAYNQFPQSKTLNDFRAPQPLINLENMALTRSRHIITPHKEIAEIFNNKSIKLDWTLPSVKTATKRGNKILFPASALGRKGAYEMKRLARELDLEIVLGGQTTEDENFWKGVKTEPCGSNPLENVNLVVYPTYIEHQPRLLLKALAKGIPVITTTACGLSPNKDLTIVPMGDYKTLKERVKKYLNEDHL